MNSNIAKVPNVDKIYFYCIKERFCAIILISIRLFL